jgi:hypothetical protein
LEKVPPDFFDRLDAENTLRFLKRCTIHFWCLHAIPNSDNAVISIEKLRDYLLNSEHRRGGHKAKLLLAFGYRTDNPERLDQDLRAQHLTAECHEIKQSPWGTRYEIRSPLATPNGRTIMMESIWQIDTGTDVPRFITMYPR